MPSMRKSSEKRTSPKGENRSCSFRFEAVKLDSLFPALDAVAWIDKPNVGQVAQFAGIDPRTAGKLLKNASIIAVIDVNAEERFSLRLSYPYKQGLDKKQAVVREALVRMPLLASIRQFIGLKDPLKDAVRKGATVAGVENFDEAALAPLLDWAKQLNALEPGIVAEDLVEAATENKEQRHREKTEQRVVFLSHSSVDKPLIRQLATDLSAEGIGVWLDEQKIRVGDSIPQRLDQGLAQSDFFLIALSKTSVESDWVKKELNSALMRELGDRKTAILPVKLDDVEIPAILKDRKYADLSRSYKAGLRDLLSSIRSRLEGNE